MIQSIIEEGRNSWQPKSDRKNPYTIGTIEYYSFNEGWSKKDWEMTPDYMKEYYGVCAEENTWD